MKTEKYIVVAVGVLIGAMFLIAGLTKAFVSGPNGVAGFFGSLGIPAPLFFAWVVMLSEIVFGLLVIAQYKLKYTAWPLVVIMVVSAFLVQWGNWSSFLMHLIVGANLAWFGMIDLKMGGRNNFRLL
jgi:putative oxidoreductase